jgi:hypothetical protein
MTPTKGGMYLLTRDGRREKIAVGALISLAFPPAPVPEPELTPEPMPEPEPAAPEEKFALIAHIPGYEISRAGVVRNAATKSVMKLRTHLVETFGAGAAAAAGLPEPNMNKVEASRKQAVERRESSLPSKKVKNNPNLRKCASCGKPTVNYRCSKCWAKVRGFGLDDPRMSVYGE